MDNIDKETFIKLQEKLSEISKVEKEKKNTKKQIQSIVKDEAAATNEIKIEEKDNHSQLQTIKKEESSEISGRNN